MFFSVLIIFVYFYVRRNINKFLNILILTDSSILKYFLMKFIDSNHFNCYYLDKIYIFKNVPNNSNINGGYYMQSGPNAAQKYLNWWNNIELLEI